MSRQCDRCNPSAPLGLQNTICEECGCCNHTWVDGCECEAGDPCGCLEAREP